MKKSLKTLLIVGIMPFALALGFSGCDAKEHTHTLVKTEAVGVTCTTDGNDAYWTCSDCGKVYADESATTETTAEAQKRSATGHGYGEPTYVWSDDNSTCTATRVCAYDGTHIETESATASVKTSAEGAAPGTGEYTASFENTAFETQLKTAARQATIDATEMTSEELKTAFSDMLKLGERDIAVTLASDADVSVIRTALSEADVEEGSISLTLDGVTWIGEDFPSCQELKSVVLGDSVTGIGYWAFLNCKNLTSVTIGKNVTGISNEAFFGCYRLAEVCNLSALTVEAGSWDNGYVGYYALNVYTSPSSESKVKKLGDYTLYEDGESRYLLGYNGTATELTLPDVFDGNAYAIYDHAFNGCSSLTSVTIGDNVTSIGDSAFSNCENLTSVTFGDNVTSVGAYAFTDCMALTSVTIGKNVEDVGDQAFANCHKLIEVCNLSALTITAGSEENGYVGYYALNVYTASSGESKLKTIGDYLLYEDGATRYLLGYNGTATELILPDAFNGKTYEIYDFAFYRCSKLTSVVLGDHVTSIGAGAFQYCNSLTSVTLSDNVESIGNHAFHGCDNLASIKLGSRVVSIGDYAFYGCDNLASIKLGDNVTSIGDRAFYDCDKLTGITFGGKVESIGAEAFFSCDNLTNVTIGKNVTSIGSNAFIYCYKLVEVCNLSTLTIGTGLKDNGYVGCYALNVYTASSGASKVKTVDGYLLYEDGDTRYLLGYEETVTELTLPDVFNGNDYAIYDYAFDSCLSLTSVKIGDNVTGIGNQAFDGCLRLTSVVIGDSVTSIDDYAFSSCYELTSVYYKGNAETWNSITVGEYNTYLTDATVYYYSETEPTDADGNYWHYDGDSVVVW